MAVVQPVTLKTESPDTDFWQECRRLAAILNIPAWQLAEEGFKHEDKSSVSNKTS
jgi:hypothetical protein